MVYPTGSMSRRSRKNPVTGLLVLIGLAAAVSTAFDGRVAAAAQRDSSHAVALSDIEPDLLALAEMVGTPIPPEAPWVLIGLPAGTKPFLQFQFYSEHGSPTELSGWLLGEDERELHVLDFLGYERRIPRQGAIVVRRTLADEIGAANPDFVVSPQLLPAAWALQRGDRKTAAALALPVYRSVKDAMKLRKDAAEMITDGLRGQLLCAYGRERDFDRAIPIARHLAGPHFQDSAFQKQAAELADQMAARIGLPEGTLPTMKEWNEKRAGMTHEQELRELLFLLFAKLPEDAPPQTGVVPYSERYLDPLPTLSRSFKAKPPDVEILITYLDDTRYLPDQIYSDAFGLERRCYPGHWRQVSQLAASLIVEARGIGHADLNRYLELDAAARESLKKELLAWSREHPQVMETDRLLEQLQKHTDAGARRHAANELAWHRDMRALPFVLELAEKDAEFRERSIGNLYLYDSDAFVPLARQWLAEWWADWQRLDAPARARATSGNTPPLLWAALMLLRRGDRANAEGLEAIRSVLEADRTGWSYGPAWRDVWDTGLPEARSMLLDVLDKSEIFDRIGAVNSTIACRLFESGAARFVELLLERLSSDADMGKGYGSMAAERASNVTEGYRVAEMLAEWSEDGPDAVVWNWADSTAERDAKRERLKQWFLAQHELQKAGKPTAIGEECSKSCRSMVPLPPVKR